MKIRQIIAIYFLILLSFSSLLPSTVSGDASAIWEGEVAIATGKEHFVVLYSDGTVWAWGGNTYGQLGNGTTKDSSKPAKVEGLGRAVAIAAGDYHTMALKSDGTVWAWGSNTHGQIGIKKRLDDIKTLAICKPVKIVHLDEVVSIAAGARHNLALRADGMVRAWGDNAWGQLGDWSTDSRESTGPVSFLGRTQTISAAGFSSAALLLDGTVRTWGANLHGHLGNGRRGGIQLLPEKVEGLKDVADLAMGNEHMVVLKTDGTVWAWGNNVSGQVGDGTCLERLQPVQVKKIKKVVSIVAGERHALAITDDGAVWSWGDNGYGQIGDGTTRNRPFPVKQTELQDVACVAAGDEHSLALDANGTIWAWGSSRLLSPGSLFQVIEAGIKMYNTFP